MPDELYTDKESIKFSIQKEKNRRNMFKKYLTVLLMLIIIVIIAYVFLSSNHEYLSATKKEIKNDDEAGIAITEINEKLENISSKFENLRSGRDS